MDYLDHARQTLGLNGILNAVVKALNDDLHNGPLYTDGKGEQVECFDFDENPRQFNFSRALEILGGRIDNLETYYVDCNDDSFWGLEEPESLYDDESEEYIPPLPYFEIQPSDYLPKLIGRELASYI